MREFSKVGRMGTVGCEELGRLDLVDTSLSCKICHSVERHGPGALARMAFVAHENGTVVMEA